MSKLPDAIFKFIEYELYNLDSTKRELEELKMDMSEGSIGGMEYNDMSSGPNNENHSSTETTALDIMTNKAIMRAAKTIKDIEDVKQQLDEQKLRLFHLKYKRNRPWQQITDDLSISETTYFRWRKEIVERVAQKMGFME